jgi:membrane protease YdiL (CAAX protease family)
LTDDRGVGAARAALVPVWHPAALVALMLLVSAVGGVLSAQQHALPAPRGGSLVVRAYVPLLLVSWGLLLYVCRVGRSRFVFAELVASGAYTPRRALGDVALSCLAASMLIGGEVAWQAAFGAARNAAAEALLPSTALERVVWCAVALSAALSEEIVYRGYLATELTRWTASRAAGVLGQAALFALAHGEQGGGAMLRFFVYASGLCVLARARRSLVPGILAHAGVDLLAGLGH